MNIQYDLEQARSFTISRTKSKNLSRELAANVIINLIY